MSARLPPTLDASAAVQAGELKFRLDGAARVLVLASFLIVWRAIERLAGSSHPQVDVPWYALARWRRPWRS